MRCVDLRSRFGKLYRVTVSPEWSQIDHKLEDKKWFLVIFCRNGVIYPHSAARVGFASKSRMGPTLKKLRETGLFEVTQDGDDGFNGIFRPEDMPKLKKYFKPMRKRQLSPGQKRAGAVRFSLFRENQRATDLGEKYALFRVPSLGPEVSVSLLPSMADEAARLSGRSLMPVASSSHVDRTSFDFPVLCLKDLLNLPPNDV